MFIYNNVIELIFDVYLFSSVGVYTWLLILIMFSKISLLFFFKLGGFWEESVDKL